MQTQGKLTEKQSITLMQEMLEASSRNIKKDGIVLIVWGIVVLCNSFFNFFPEVKLISRTLHKSFDVFEVILGASAVLFTVYYIYANRKRTKTYIGITARYTWFAVLVVYNLVTVLIHQKTGEVNFELLHPIQMTLIGLGLFVTGGLYRQKLLLLGGFAYWIAAYFAIGYRLPYQWIFEFVAAIIGFIIPGYFLYKQSRK